MRCSFSPLPLGAIAVLALALLSTPLHAAEPLSPAAAEPAELTADHEPAPPRAMSAEEALLVDAGSYAADFAVDLDEAVRRLKLQGSIGDRLAELEIAAGERFAGAWIEHQPEYRAVVRLAGDAKPSAELAALAADAPVEVVLTTEADASLATLLAAIDAHLAELQQLLPGLAATDVDVKTGEIELIVDQEHAAELTTERTLEVADLLGHPVRFDLLDAPIGDDHTRGGAHLSSCTSGFVVADSNGTRGYVTSGHCGDSQTYYEYGGTSYSTTFIDEIRDADQDVQWHTTSHAEYPHFYASSTSSYRTLTAQKNRSSQAVGNYVCHRGKPTGYSCGNIDSKTFKPTWSNACNGQTCSSVWIKLSGSSLKCYSGDSGGPYFNGTTAYGIAKGSSSSGTSASDCNWAVYMAVNYLGISLVFG